MWANETICLTLPTEHYRNLLTDNTLGENGQIVFGRQGASKFHITLAGQLSCPKDVALDN
jgi:hypothetical protein